MIRPSFLIEQLAAILIAVHLVVCSPTPAGNELGFFGRFLNDLTTGDTVQEIPRSAEDVNQLGQVTPNHYDPTPYYPAQNVDNTYHHNLQGFDSSSRRTHVSGAGYGGPASTPFSEQVEHGYGQNKPYSNFATTRGHQNAGPPLLAVNRPDLGTYEPYTRQMVREDEQLSDQHSFMAETVAPRPASLFPLVESSSVFRPAQGTQQSHLHSAGSSNDIKLPLAKGVLADPKDDKMNKFLSEKYAQVKPMKLEYQNNPIYYQEGLEEMIRKQLALNIGVNDFHMRPEWYKLGNVLGGENGKLYDRIRWSLSLDNYKYRGLHKRNLNDWKSFSHNSKLWGLSLHSTSEKQFPLPKGKRLMMVLLSDLSKLQNKSYANEDVYPVGYVLGDLSMKNTYFIGARRRQKA